MMMPSSSLEQTHLRNSDYDNPNPNQNDAFGDGGGEEGDNNEYLELAIGFKDRGNDAFKRGAYADAIKLYSQGLDIDPDNIHLYSNRSAAHLKNDSKSLALYDAEKCVRLCLSKPWDKAYNRLAAAQQSLGRFEAAIESYKRAAELDPGNKANWSNLSNCQEAFETRKRERNHEAALERQRNDAYQRKLDLQRQEAMQLRQENRKEEEEDLLDSFFSEVGGEIVKSSSSSSSSSSINRNSNRNSSSSSSSSNTNSKVHPSWDNSSDLDSSSKPSKVHPSWDNSSDLLHQSGSGNSDININRVSGGDVSVSVSSSGSDGKVGPDDYLDDLLGDFFAELQPNNKPQLSDGTGEVVVPAVYTPKYMSADLGDGRAQVERLMRTNYKWYNLNPYYVLQLDIDATEEDIKYRYRKLSSKVHPDKLLGVEPAREAFEQVKAAYLRLIDPEQRATIIKNIEFVSNDIRKDRKKQLAKAGGGVDESSLLPLEMAVEKAVMKLFADIEQQKRRSETLLRMYNGREKGAAHAEEELSSRLEERDQAFLQDDRRDKRVGDWRSFQAGGGAGGAGTGADVHANTNPSKKPKN